MGKIPEDFGSCLMPSDAAIVDNQSLLDAHTERLLANEPRNRFGPRPHGSNSEGNPFQATQPLLSTTLGYPSKAVSAAEGAQSPTFGGMIKAGVISVGGRSNEQRVLELIEKILQKAGR